MVENDQLLAYLKKVSADLYEARERLRTVEESEIEPIAVVGLGCRLPGGSNDPESFWRVLTEGCDVVTGFPTDRGWEAMTGQAAEIGLELSSVQGGFLHDAAMFDAGFFGISPREALAMDPQQRVLLETSWEAIERSGIDPLTLRGSATGVFVGAAFAGYDGTASREANGYGLTGGLTAVISGRVSYALGLEGPAVTVDTACSSSLVSIHLACQALRADDCNLALAGGVTVMAGPGAFAEFSLQQGLASDGRCKAFGAEADGTGWAEGAGLVVLERLSDARRHGRRVLAVVRGSAVNQDGASNGLTAPNGPSQQRVIRAALVNARLRTVDVDAVEAHGTGTVLGDPIEAQALLATYGQGRPENRPLWLGSVKSSIGHAQAAAGVAGVIKMVLALRNGVLPPTLHAERPSEHVDWTGGQVRLLTRPLPWQPGEDQRRAGVSAFGISGTNAHVILEEAAPAADAPAPTGERVLTGEATAWLVSGRGRDAMRARARQLADLAGAADLSEERTADVAWSLAVSRSAFEDRGVVVSAGAAELAAGLLALATDRPHPGVIAAKAQPGEQRLVLVFPGQGSQWVGMGQELVRCSPVFATRLGECETALAPFVDWSVADVLAGVEGAPGLDRVDVVQPVLWAVMVSLAAVWQGAGVVPDAVLGHSQGEIAAAVVAGALSLQDGARVVALRSQALTALSGLGAMASITEPAQAVTARIAAWGDAVTVAALNGPTATVVSGDPHAVEQLVAGCETDGVRARTLPVDYASHGPQIDQLRDQILDLLATLTPRPTQIPMISAMTAQPLTGTELDARYWYDSLRAPVRFADAVRALASTGYQTFIECSPHPVLTTPITDTLTDTLSAGESGESGREPLVLGTLRRDDGGATRLLTSLAEAFVHGVPVDWRAVLPAGQLVDLPTYPFQRTRYWAAPPVPQAAGDGAHPAGAAFWSAVEEGDVDGVAATLRVDGATPLHDLLPALAAWHRRRTRRAVTDGWRYRITWARRPEPEPATLTGTWLMLAGPAGRALAGRCWAALEAAGARVVQVDVDPARVGREDLGEALRASPESPVGVLSLLALDEEVAAGSQLPVGVRATLALAQALGDSGTAARAWAVTRHAVAAVPGEFPAATAQAQVWAMGRAIALEHPARWGGLVDLPVEPDDAVWRRLVAVLAAGTSGPGSEDQVALRASDVLARRLVRAPHSGRDRRWTTAGSVLLTGGTGAAGGSVARWLVGRGAQRLVLTGRSGPAAPGAAALAAELAAAGTRTEVLAADAADRPATVALLDWVDRSGPALSAVVHAAGTGQTTPLDDMTTAELDALYSGKVTGALLLDELTTGRPLDAFVLFSSGAAVWGSALQAGYAAANAALDALAENRRGRGLPATSVSWGVWGGGGMVTGEAREYYRRAGIREMDPRLVIDALAGALDDGDCVLTVTDMDWARFAPVFTVQRPSPLIGDLPEVQQALAQAAAGTGEDPAGEPGGALAVRLRHLLRDEQEQALTALVQAEAAAVLGYPSAAAVESDRTFKDLGFDSMTAVELRNRLRPATGLKLSPTLVFDYPTPAALGVHLRAGMLPADAAGPESVPEQIERLHLALVGLDPDDGQRQEITKQLRGVLSNWLETQTAHAPAVETAVDLRSASTDELFGFLDQELGSAAPGQATS